ncbi:MAG: glycosyltransferase family 39 protein [Rhodomicrobium sp.]
MRGLARSNEAALKTIFNTRFGPALIESEKLVIAACFALFFATWALYGSITQADKSLHHDVLEAYAWGKEFKLGYHQHGPFWAWISGLWFLLFPNTNTSFILLAALNATLGLLGAWRLNGLFAQSLDRHAATLLLLVTPFYTFLSFKYNANTIFLSLWPWTLFFFVMSLDNMKMQDALVFGVLAAASILSKYFAIVLLLTCAASLAFHENGRKYIRSPLPYMAAGIFSLAVLPHLIWLIATGAPPVAYAMGLAGRGYLFSIQNSASFLPSTGLYHSIILIIVLFSRYSLKEKSVGFPSNPVRPSRQQFLTTLVLAPPLLTLVFGLCFQLKISTNMAVGTFPLVPLFLMQLAAPLDQFRCFQISAWFAIAVTLGALATAPFVTAIIAQTSRDPVLLEPRRELAAHVTTLWRAETNTPLRFAGAERHYANAISFYSADRPSSFADLSYAKAPWVTPAKLQRYGLLIACVHEDTACHLKAAEFLSGNWKQTSIRIGHTIGKHQLRAMTFDVFIVPPQRPYSSSSETAAHLVPSSRVPLLFHPVPVRQTEPMALCSGNKRKNWSQFWS